MQAFIEMSHWSGSSPLVSAKPSVIGSNGTLLLSHLQGWFSYTYTFRVSSTMLPRQQGVAATLPSDTVDDEQTSVTALHLSQVLMGQGREGISLPPMRAHDRCIIWTVPPCSQLWGWLPTPLPTGSSLLCCQVRCGLHFPECYTWYGR